MLLSAKRWSNILHWLLGSRARVLGGKIRNGKWLDSEMHKQSLESCMKRRERCSGTCISSPNVYTLSEQRSQVLISFVDCRSNARKARIRYAQRCFKFRRILAHNTKFQDQSSKWYHYIKAYTHMFSMVPFSGSHAVGLRGIFKISRGLPSTLRTLNTISLREHTLVFSDYKGLGSTAASTQCYCARK